MKKRLLTIMTLTSISLTNLNAAAATDVSILEARITTARNAILHASTLSNSDQTAFYERFTEREDVPANEVFRLAQQVEPDTAANLYEIYVARANSTKALILQAAELMRALGSKYRERTEVLETLASSIK
jgi:hypothetical protein